MQLKGYSDYKAKFDVHKIVANLREAEENMKSVRRMSQVSAALRRSLLDRLNSEMLQQQLKGAGPGQSSGRSSGRHISPFAKKVKARRREAATLSQDKRMDKWIVEHQREEHQRWLGNVDYQRKLHNWSLDVARRESSLNAKFERDRLAIVPPGAVLMKPAG